MMSIPSANIVDVLSQHPPRTTVDDDHDDRRGARYRQNAVVIAATSAATPTAPRNMTVQLLVPEPIAAQYGGTGGRGCGRGENQ